MHGLRRPVALLGALLTVAVGLSLAARGSLARSAVASVALACCHVVVRSDAATVGTGEASFYGVTVDSVRGEPIARIRRVRIAYALRDLFPGGTHPLGLTALTLDSPQLTIVRYADGSYNVPLPRFNGGSGKTQALRLALAVRDGSVTIEDRGNVDPHQRRLYVDRATVDATVDTLGQTTYAVRFEYGERPDRLYPVTGRGDADARTGIALHEWKAARLPIAGAVDFLLNSPSLHVAAGELRDVHARIVDGHVGASAWLQGGRIAVGGLTKPIDGVHGRIDAFDDGLLAHGLRASVAGAPVVVNGGAFGLAHPVLRLGVTGRGDLARLRTAFAPSGSLPISGPIDFRILAEGEIAHPLTWIALDAPRTRYGSFGPVTATGLVALGSSYADVVAVRAGAAGTQVLARAAFALPAPAGAPPPPRSSGIVAAGGSWGALSGTGTFDGRAGAFTGTYGGFGTSGQPVSVVATARDVLAQVHGRAIRATVEANPRNFTIYGLRAFLKGGEALAAGTSAGGRAIGVSLRNVAVAGGRVSAGAVVSGAPSAPRAQGSFVVAGAQMRGTTINGSGAVAYDAGSLNLSNAQVEMGPAFADVSGAVRGVSPAGIDPRYDLHARVQSSNLAGLLALGMPAGGQSVQGSVDANVRVGGAGSAPYVTGTLSMPEVSVNGLAVRDVHASISGAPSAIAVAGGRATVGSTAIAFDANASRAATTLAVRAPAANLADFNDLFDTGDMFAGKGIVALDASLDGTRVLASSGDVAVSGARYRSTDLGTVRARWHAAGGGLAGTASVASAHGRFEASGTVASIDVLHPAAALLDVRASAHRADLAAWLPMLGIRQPVTGRLDAGATVRGRYPDADLAVRGSVTGATAGRLPIQQLTFDATASRGRGTLRGATLRAPSLSAGASGTFGLHPNDRIAILAHADSPDVAALAAAATGKTYDAAGRLATAIAFGGTAAHPRLTADVTATDLRYRTIAVPRAVARIDATRSAIALRNGEVDLQRGTILAAATMPLRGTHIAGSVSARDVDAATVASLFPKGTHLTGRIDGRMTVGGTLDAPQLGGSMSLADATFIGPMERAPISHGFATLRFSGTQARLEDAHVAVGGGSVAATATARVANLRSLAGAAFTLDARAENAHLEMPAYFTGNFDGTLHLAKAAGTGPIRTAGALSVYDARLPLSAFFNPNAKNAGTRQLPDVAFEGFHVSAGRDVRVQSNEVDVGATGSVRMHGTLAKPALAGAFHLTGGTVDFYRNFTVRRGTIAFDRRSGIIPYVDAIATTYVTDPQTAVRLHVTGPASDLNLALASDPSYDREQILGLLVGANQLGAVRGVQSSANGASGAFSLPGAARNVALGQANAVFMRHLLEPLSASLGSAMGFTDLQITNDLQTGLGLGATKAFGKDVTATLSDSLGYPRTQSVALEARPTTATSLRLRMYSSEGPSLFNVQPVNTVGVDALNLNPMTQLATVGGTNGVDFSLVRKFP